MPQINQSTQRAAALDKLIYVFICFVFEGTTKKDLRFIQTIET